MAGRPAKPIELHIAGGNARHLTKEEIEDRKNSEIKFGEQKFICPVYVSSNYQAKRKWNECIALYQDVEFVASGDAGLLARYCVTYSEYLDLIKRRKSIDKISKNCDDVEDYIDDAEFNYRIRQKLLDMCSTAAVLNLDTAINKKMEMLIKMEDRLFLNPLAKVKNVPKKQKEEPASKWDKFKSG